MSSYIIYVGRYQLNGFGQPQSLHRISQVLIPQGYSEPHSGLDLALVQLSSPITWSDYAQPICLPASSIQFPSGMMCTVTGWGNINEGGRNSGIEIKSILQVFSLLHIYLFLYF